MTTVAPGDIRQAFADAVGAENVTLDVDGYSVDGLAPSLIVRPSDIHELSRAMAVAAELRLAVAPRGEGTRMEVGTPPSGWTPSWRCRVSITSSSTTRPI